MGWFKKPSWKRLTGVTRGRQKLARATGIPTTRSGRERKLGRRISNGCRRQAALVLVAAAVLGAATVTLVLAIL